MLRRMPSYLDNLVIGSLIASRGKELCDNDAVRIVERDENRVVASVQGIHANYSVRLHFDANKKLLKYKCDCPARIFCKHEAAVLYALERSAPSVISVSHPSPEQDYWDQFNDLLQYGVVSRIKNLVHLFASDFLARDKKKAIDVLMRSLSLTAEAKASAYRSLDYMNDYFNELSDALGPTAFALQSQIKDLFDASSKPVKASLFSICINVHGLSQCVQSYYMEQAKDDPRRAARLLNTLKCLPKSQDHQRDFMREIAIYRPSILSYPYALSLLNEYLSAKDAAPAESIFNELLSLGEVDSASLAKYFKSLKEIDYEGSSRIAMGILRRSESAEEIYPIYLAMGERWIVQAVMELLIDDDFDLRPIAPFLRFLAGLKQRGVNARQVSVKDLFLAKGSFDDAKRRYADEAARLNLDQHRLGIVNKKETIASLLLLSDPSEALALLSGFEANGTLNADDPEVRCTHLILEEASHSKEISIIALEANYVHI